MRYYSQKENCCLAAALYQVGAISIDILHAYEKNSTATTLVPALFQQNWCKSFLTPLVDFFSNEYYIGSDNEVPVPVPLTGKGILILKIEGKHLIRHAISYENGLVLDPVKKEKLTSWKLYSQEYPDRIIIKVIPTG